MLKKITTKKVFLPIACLIFCFFITKSCSFHSLPKEKIPAIILDIDEKYVDGLYELVIKNPLGCPMRFFLNSQVDSVKHILIEKSPILIEANSDTSIYIKDQGDLRGKIKFNVKWGNQKLPIKSNKMHQLPFPNDKKYKLLQGNNSNPTHNTELSRYAFDFTLNSGDTIVSTQNGYVVTVIDGYKGWGMSNKWKSYGNQIMIYDTASHLFTMYGHLKQNGSLVQNGAFVKVGQPIAISGKTGQLTEEHLHYNVFRANNGNSGLKSYPLDSIGKYEVKKLKRSQWMENQ